MSEPITPALLAIDASTHTTSIALYDARGVLGEVTWRTRENHTRSLMPAIVHLLDEQGYTPAMLGAVAVATGPGSFTGLRIGLSAAKGLAYGIGAVLIGVPTLQVTAFPFDQFGQGVWAVLQAGRTRYGAAYFHGEGGSVEQVGEPMFGTADEVVGEILARTLTPTIVAGEIDANLRARLEFASNVQVIENGRGLRRAGNLAELAWARWQRGESDAIAALTPFYIPTPSFVEKN